MTELILKICNLEDSSQQRFRIQVQSLLFQELSFIMLMMLRLEWKIYLEKDFPLMQLESKFTDLWIKNTRM